MSWLIILRNFCLTSYELAKLIPDDFHGTMPTIEEIENELNKNYRPISKNAI